MRISVAVLLGLLAIASAPVAYAHASLTQASPPAGAALDAPPQDVTLTFTDTLEAAFSNLRVTDANGAEVDQGTKQVSGNVMRVGLKPLSAGTYKVNWRAISADSHKTEGSFTFRVAPKDQ